ncbi:hypothetical protein I6I76_05755 [Dermacoccus nishinomiyaensis]|nr:MULTISPECIES: hypothetical protein [Dermacoccus]QQY25622.1 hypothetical protein I6I76_05755 [Dermacoccus nishinomiyaensis]
MKLHPSAFKHGLGEDDIAQAASWPQGEYPRRRRGSSTTLTRRGHAPAV